MRFEPKNFLFLAVMLGAAALSLLRVLLVANSLPTGDFAGYAAVTATGAFLGGIISFGAVEGTIKRFPRLVALGHFNAMLSNAHKLLKTLLLRAGILGLPIYLLGWSLDSSTIKIAGVAFLFALAAGYSSVVASMQRAVGNPTRLAAGTVFRAGLSFVTVVGTAQFAGMVPVLAVEALAGLAGCVISERLFLRREVSTETPAPLAARDGGSGRGGDGVWVFLAFTVISIPFYLDRLYVTAVLGTEDAARYAVLALFLMGASLLVNTIAQRVGPHAIKLAMSRSHIDTAYRYVLKWCAVTAAIWFFTIGGSALAFSLGLVPAGLAKYQIEFRMFLPLSVLGALFSTALLEFLMIGLDQERPMLLSAIAYFAAVAAVALIIFAVPGDLYMLIWLLAGARLFYGLILTFVLRSTLRANRAATDE